MKFKEVDTHALKNKVTLITGGTGGIGSALCKKFAGLGSLVYINDVKNTSALANEINSKFRETRAIPVKADIADKNQVRKMFDRIQKENGGVDILINNAAVFAPPPNHFHEITFENFKKVIRIDLHGAVYCTILAIKQMIPKKWGRIMFTAAPMSSSGIPSPYLAGKAGFIGLTKYLSVALNKYGIKTWAVALRHVYTPMLEGVMKSRGKNPVEARKKMDELSLTGGMAVPEEIADMFAYYALPFSDCISGQVIVADGGITYLR